MTYNPMPGGQPGVPQPGGVPQAPMPMNAPTPDGPMGQLVVNIQGSVMTNMLTPTLMVDGYQTPSSFGVNTLVVPAGVHRVELHAQWLRKYGQAAIDVQVPPNGTAQVFYAAPRHQFASTGSIGFEKQRAKGTWVLWLMIAIIIVFTLLTIVIALSAS